VDGTVFHLSPERCSRPDADEDPMQRVPMTPEGHAQLVKDLKYLKEFLRMKIVQDIEEARAHGDISENSEFEDAKHRQALCEGRIRDLEGKLAACEVIDVTKLKASDRVIFGTTVEIEDVDTDEEMTFKIVGTDEADVKKGRISVTSPLGRALVGRESGDDIKVQTPNGIRNLVINDVQYK
jgi:transcription elongation factor GreA